MVNKSRRDFLKVLAAGTCGGIAHQLLAPASGFLAYADPLDGDPTDRVLILLNFAGGASLNIAPIYHSQYRDRNPTISYGEDNSITLNGVTSQGLHPSLTSFTQVWNDGQLAILNGIGNGPKHSRSHDEATVQWQTGSSNGTISAAPGWGAKLTTQLQSAFGGVSLAGSNAFTRGGSTRILSSLSSLNETSIFGSTDDTMQLQFARTNLLLQADIAGSPAQEHNRESIVRLQSNLELLRPLATMSLPVTFPNTNLGRKFADAARLIAAGRSLNTRVINIEQGGYDTHSNERGQLTTLMTEVNGALGAFIACMKALNRWDDVVIFNVSEFSRTMENAGQGTDHGLAGTQFVLGGKVKGGQKTPVPTPAEIGNRDVIRATNGTFVQVFSELVGDFMRLDPTKVFNGDIASSPYFRII